MRRVLALALLALLVVQPGAAALPLNEADAVRSPDGTSTATAPLLEPDRSSAGVVAVQQQSDADWHAGTTFRVQLHESGDATWAVSMRYGLDDENETAAFQTYAAAFERGEAAGAVGPTLFEGLAAGAVEAADREMVIRNVSRSARVEGDTGVLTLSFTWTNFLGQASDSDHLVLRDALLLPDGGTWLSTLEPGQRLVVETPPGYAINATSVPVLQRSGTVIIDGPRTFPADEPLTIRYQPASRVAEIPWALIVGGIVALTIVVAVLSRRRGSRAADTTDEGVGEHPDAADGETVSDADAVAGGPGDTGPADTPEAADAHADDSEEDLSLLSDEERVERMLERNGGRMKQAQIVRQSGWSDAKVSQLLSSMAEEGHVEKLRIGRENLISLPETDVIDDGEGDDESASTP